MPRKILLVGLAALLSSCVSPDSKTSDPTSTSESTIDTADPATTTTTTTTTTDESTTTEIMTTADSGDVITLTQFGLKFAVPAPFIVDPSAGTAFRATSKSPRGLLTIESCADCTLTSTPREGETYVNTAIDGVPALIIENVALDLPDSITANEMVVADGDRAFSVIMSFEGDIKPSWDEFVASIRFVPVDLSAPTTTLPKITSEVISLDDLGITFTKPEGFEDDTEAEVAETQFHGVRYEPDLALLVIEPCPGCKREDLLEYSEKITDLTVAGYPAFEVETTAEGDHDRVVIVAAPDQPFGVLLRGEGADGLWQPLLDSIQVIKK